MNASTVDTSAAELTSDGSVFNKRVYLDKPKGPTIMDVMTMNRAQRRQIGKLNNGIKFPGLNKPLIIKRNVVK